MIIKEINWIISKVQWKIKYFFGLLPSEKILEVDWTQLFSLIFILEQCAGVPHILLIVLLVVDGLTDAITDKQYILQIIQFQRDNMGMIIFDLQGCGGS